MIPIWIYDTNLNLLAQIDNYEYLRWEKKWRSPHNFEVHINRYKKHAEHIKKDNYIVMYRNGKYRAGIIEARELQLTEEGKVSESWKVTGHSFSNLLSHRIALNGVSSGNGYDEQNSNAESLFRHYVDVNAITTDPNRVIPNLILGTDLTRGTQVQYRARFQPITQVLEELSLVSGLGYDVTVDLTNKQFVFEVLEGKDITTSQAVNSPVIFSPEFDNVKMLGFRESTMDSKTLAIVAGQGEAELREIVEIGTGTGLGRREIFVDARNSDSTDQLTQKGNETLSELKDEITIEFDHLPGGPFSYMEDFDLGDIVTINYPDIAQMDSRIIKVIEEVTPENGDQLKIVVGKEWPDIIKLIKRDRKNIENEVRR